jgi:hypothetical protein
VQFYDDVVRSAKAPNGRIYAVISDMARRVGLFPENQVRSIQKDELYQGFTIWIELHTVKKHKPYKALALDLDMVPIWLARTLAGDEAAAQLLLAGLLPHERRALRRACEQLAQWLMTLEEQTP